MALSTAEFLVHFLKGHGLALIVLQEVRRLAVALSQCYGSCCVPGTFPLLRPSVPGVVAAS